MLGGSFLQKLVFAKSLKTAFFLHIICLIATLPVSASPAKEAKLWVPVDWTFQNPSHSGNPFDLVATATFTHAPTGRKIRTELFYDGGDAWKLRFTGTQAGSWSFVTESSDPELRQ